MEGQRGDSDKEAMSTTPSPSTSGAMSVESSPKCSRSNSPSVGGAAALNPASTSPDLAAAALPPAPPSSPVGPKRPPSIAAAVQLLTSPAKRKGISPSSAASTAGPSGSAGPSGGAVLQVPVAPVKTVSPHSALHRSLSDPLSKQQPGQDASSKTGFSSVPADISTAFRRGPTRTTSSDEEDAEIAKIFGNDANKQSASDRSDNVPKKKYYSSKVLDSCSSASSPGISDSPMPVRPPNPVLETNPTVTATSSPDDVTIADDPDPSSLQSSSGAMASVAPQVPSSPAGRSRMAAVGRQGSSPRYESVPELASLQISPKSAKDAFVRGVARTSQRGPKNRPNPYNRPANSPQLRKTSSRETKSDEEDL